ncbi:MAG: hypothetical protein A2Z31_02205 [candidate division NC10 bacterium RBG_16_65_8]|nr:MAG: hypothetical protein A2Z31_02205 [candidate division NC10 bacterium RBG_16_65_8]
MLTLVVGLTIGFYLGITLMSMLAISARAQDADDSERSLRVVPAPPWRDGLAAEVPPQSQVGGSLKSVAKHD